MQREIFKNLFRLFTTFYPLSCVSWLRDKMGLQKELYNVKTFSGASIFLRGGTSDLNEALIVMSNSEYGFLIDKLRNKKITIIDAGGNIGLFTIWIHCFFDLKYSYIIEPDIENISMLNKNLENNKINNYYLYDKALYSESGKSLIFDNSVNFDARHIVSGEKQEGISGLEVKTISLMDVVLGIKKNGIDVVDILKIDIEGAEYDLLIEENKEIFSQISWIVMEYHNGDRQLLDYFGKNIVNQVIFNDLCGLIFVNNEKVL